MELSNSFKSLELDTDSSRGSRESLDSVASSLNDEQSLDKVRRRSSQIPIMTNVLVVETSVSISHCHQQSIHYFRFRKGENITDSSGESFTMRIKPMGTR